ncbi:MAG: hypothetical protein H7125_02680 [Proteobacteria bacterium]|nr:hypothetical protein [Burkholderiales bacterium]
MIRIAKFASLTTAAAVLGAFSLSASAAVVISFGGTSIANEGQTSNFAGLPGFVTYDFNALPLGPLSPATSPYSGNGQIVVGTVTGQYAAPTTPADPNTSQYLSVPIALQGQTEAEANVLVRSNYFGLWWGSVDNYNTLSFFDGANLVATIDGAMVRTQAAATPSLTPGAQDQAIYVNFQFDAGLGFDRVVFVSTDIAFESDNHVYGNTSVIPVPASGVLMLTGMLGMLFAARRERRNVQIA